jgi:RNA polymerase sigma factor (sigma-70 family)
MKLLKVVSEANSTPITSPKGLVRYVVKCTAIDALRRERRVHAMKEKVRHRFPTTPNPEEILISGEELELYLRVRASAEEPCRELWNLLLYEELTYKEIAQRLHISEGALRVRHKRCKDKAAAWIQKNK